MEKSFYHQSFKVPCESDYKKFKNQLLFLELILMETIVYEEEEK